MTFFFIFLLCAGAFFAQTGLANENGPVVLPPSPAAMAPQLTQMPDPAVIAPDTFYRKNGHPAAMDEGLVTGDSPAVVEPFHQMNGEKTPACVILPPQESNGAVDNDDPVEKNNPFAP